jgi:hypothetical protein
VHRESYTCSCAGHAAERWSVGPLISVDVIERKLRDDVKQYGWHVLKVLADEGHSSHTYSVGLYKSFGHPEVVIVGLPGDTAHAFIDNLADEIRDGAVFEAGCRYGHLIDGYDVAFVQVHRGFYQDYFGLAELSIITNHRPFPWFKWSGRTGIVVSPGNQNARRRFVRCSPCWWRGPTSACSGRDPQATTLRALYSACAGRAAEARLR